MPTTAHDLQSLTCPCCPTLCNDLLPMWGIQLQSWLCPQKSEANKVPLRPPSWSRCCHVRGFLPNHQYLSPGLGPVVTACQRFSLPAGHHSWSLCRAKESVLSSHAPGSSSSRPPSPRVVIWRLDWVKGSRSSYHSLVRKSPKRRWGTRAHLPFLAHPALFVTWSSTSTSWREVEPVAPQVLAVTTELTSVKYSLAGQKGTQDS